MLRLEMLPAEYGDCLWLEYGRAADRRVVLIDGGPKGTYERALRPRIQQLGASQPGRRPRIELLVVTHIDNDHIVGVIDLVRDATLDVEIGEIWFNGWDQIAPFDQLGVKEGIALSDAIVARKIPHNPAFGGRAVRVNDVDPREPHVLPGGLRLTVLSPSIPQLQKLRDEWESVVAEAESVADTEKPADLLGESDMPDVQALADKRFKSDNAVANGSSIVVLAEYDDRRILLAADAFAPVVEQTLGQLGHSTGNKLPLDAYKISHHGSRGNNSSSLLELVRCTNYLFSTSGARFRHPHAECIARILAYGGDRPTIYSNYRRDGNALWNHAAVKKQYRHRVVEPAAGKEGCVIEFP